MSGREWAETLVRFMHRAGVSSLGAVAKGQDVHISYAALARMIDNVDATAMEPVRKLATEIVTALDGLDKQPGRRTPGENTPEERRGPVFVYIPANCHGIPESAVTRNGLVKLLRDHAHSPNAVRFLADMVEE